MKKEGLSVFELNLFDRSEGKSFYTLIYFEVILIPPEPEFGAPEPDAGLDPDAGGADPEPGFEPGAELFEITTFEPVITLQYNLKLICLY